MWKAGRVWFWGVDVQENPGGTPEARSHLCVFQASFLMTFALGRIPHAGSWQNGALLELWGDPQCSSRVETKGMSGNFLSCLKGVKDFFEAPEGGGISLVMLQQKRASFCIEGRISCFFSSCGRKLGVPLKLHWGHQGPARVASGMSNLHASCKGPLRIPLQSFLGPRSSSGVEGGTSGFLSSADMDLGVPLEFPQGSQALSCVETCKSIFLLSWKSSIRLPIELT